MWFMFLHVARDVSLWYVIEIKLNGMGHGHSNMNNIWLRGIASPVFNNYAHYWQSFKRKMDNNFTSNYAAKKRKCAMPYRCCICDMRFWNMFDTFLGREGEMYQTCLIHFWAGWGKCLGKPVSGCTQSGLIGSITKRSTNVELSHAELIIIPSVDSVHGNISRSTHNAI